jgi:Ca2+-binding RTX toxin-like protein
MGPLTAYVATALLTTPFLALSGQPSEEPPTCRGRVATIVGTAGEDTLVGTDGDPGARVVIRAGAGDDVLAGTPRDDVLDGGAGDDTVRVSTGDDTCRSVERFVAGLIC